MIELIIYLIVALILCFILHIAFKGISRGLEAKNNNKKILLISKKKQRKTIPNKLKIKEAT